VAPCDPKLAIFVILGAMNWVPKWFKPSGAWKPEQLTRALSEIFDRAISSTPVAAMARDVGDLPLGETAKAGQGRDAARSDERKRRDEMVESRGRLRRAGKIGASSR
jgi:TetR/AcrR family transcriptional regulator